VLFAKIRDPGREPLALAGRIGGAAGVLENRDGAGVGPPAGLEQHLIRDEHVERLRLLRLFCLAGFGEAQAPVGPRIPVGVLVREAPGLLDVSLIQQRVDEPAEVALAQGQACGFTLDIPRT
jgi:hypothetical protein